MAASPDARIPVHELLQEVAQAVRPELTAEIRLRRQIEAKDLECAVEAGALRSLVERLITTAAGELIPGGGSLELSLFDVEIDDARIAARHGIEMGTHARLAVRAMPADPENDPRLFVGAAAEELGDPVLVEFADEFRSLGARLHMHIVGGRLQIFTAYMPATRTADLDADNVTRGCGTVLFIDDDDALVDIHRRSIESLGYEVIDCTVAQEALELIARFPSDIDVVISDLGMPDMRGDELARRIHAITPGLPIGLSTGLAVASGDRGVTEEEFEILLAKPFSLEELSHALDSLRKHGWNTRGDESRA